MARKERRTDEREDITTIGEVLFDKEASIEIRKRALENPILDRKIRLTERAYYALSNGKMDTQFWTDIVEGKKIDATYWKTRGTDFVKDDEGEKLRASFETWDVLLAKEKELQAASAPKIEFAKEHVKALKKAPHREIYRKLDGLCSELSREQAIQVLEEVIDESTPYWIYSHLSYLYEEKKDFASATTVWKRMIKFIPCMSKDGKRRLQDIEEEAQKK